MNQRDRENVQFLLSIGPEVLEDWYNKTSADDHEYAMELIAMYHEELKLKLSMYECEHVTSTTEALVYLKKFSIK